MGHLSFFQFLRNQFKSFPPPAKCDLSGKTVLVVGANVGIGLEAAKHFARMQPGRLIVTARDATKGQATVSTIQKETGFGNVSARNLELSSFASVAAFADAFEKEEERLDIYVYNAGISTQQYAVTEDGWESTLQVNDLSCTLLSMLLLPRMLESAKTSTSHPRMVIVASEVHFWVTVNDEEHASPRILEKANNREYCEASAMARRYFFSKLLNVMFVRELAARLPSDSPVTADCVNPGLCSSELGRNASLIIRAVSYLLQFVMRTPEQGSRQLIWAALGGRDREDVLRGAYVSDHGVEEPSDFLLGEQGVKDQKRILVSGICAFCYKF
ncbi:short-chain dehydrogenase [Dentipellis sp. KUC8613]|nr:short-chain dehydrogenase [Dentipellis sp. KUC8613]